MRRSFVKYIFFVLFLFGMHLSAKTKFDKIVLNAILSNECLKINGKYYPYFIAVNGKNNLKRAKKYLSLQNIKWKGNVMICFSKAQCIYLTKGLIRYGIQNIDIGPYQINYYYHPVSSLAKYFSFKQASTIADNIIQKLGKKYGYKWETLGKYHSFKKDENKKYYMKLYAYIYKIKKQ